MPETDDAFARIQDHRSRIDAIDKQLVDLLNQRAVQSLAIRALKPGAHMGLYDPKREDEIFEKLYQFNDGPLYNDNLREIYEGILKVMKEMPAL
jgi:chorismate mutase